MTPASSPDVSRDLAADVAALAAQLAEVRATLRLLEDRLQIGDLCVRYMRGFDRNDVELMRTAFWPDVQITYGTEVNTFDDFLVNHLDRHTGLLAGYGHLVTNQSVDIEGDTAHVETYVTAFYEPAAGDTRFYGRETPLIVAGRYVDRVDRRGGEWRIAVREFVPHFGSVGGIFDLAGHDEVRDRRDVSYRRPLERR